MHSTKSQILAALKRQGRCSVDELAIQLSLASMTVRQHLATLERDSLVSSNEERQRLGRPHFVYFLTDKGEESFPKPFDRIAQQLLQEVACLSSNEIAGLTADEKRGLLLDKLADRFIDQHRAAVEALPLAQRVRAVADLLQAEGGFAEWSRVEGGFEIRDYNCCYRRLDGAAPESCRWHERVLASLLGVPVACGDELARAPQVCRFAIWTEDQAACWNAAGLPDTGVLTAAYALGQPSSAE